MGNDLEDDFDGAEVLAAPSPTFDSPAAAVLATVSKSKRKREAEKAKKAKRRKESIEDDDGSGLIFEEGKGGINTAIAKLDPQLIADYVGQKVKRFEKELSAVELEDRYIPASAFLDTTSWQKDRNLANLPEFMEAFSRFKGRGASLKKASANNGTPHTLIISAAALRAADLTRAVRKFQSQESAVAKLFAKHIKLKESIEHCQKTRIGIGVGTPERVLALINEDVLRLDDLKRIIIDASRIDEKKRGIFEFHPQMSPKMSPMFPSFSGCNSLDTALPAPRWHSMPESFSPPPFPIISAGNEIPKVEESAPLLRSRSESIRCSRSPENGVLSEWHPQFRSLKQVSLEKGNATKGNENKLEDYKRSRPQQAGQKVDGDVDQKTLKNIFEWKVVDSGSQKAQHGTGLGSGKQKFATSHRKTNEKKNIFKKAVSVMKDGGKNNNARVDNSSEAKGITLLKRTPKAEVAAKNPSKVSGESPIASNTDAYDCPKDVDEVDLDNSESDSLDISYGKSTTISRHDGASSLQRAEGNNFGDFSNCTGKGHSNAYLESKARDHINGMHSDCDMEERILFTPDYGGWKEESGLELASTLPDLNDRNHLPKGSNEALRVGCEVKSNEPGAVEIPLNPEDSSKGLFLEATGALSLDDIGKKVCAVSQCLHMTENWAGPAYSNSPPPSSLPLPKFSMRQMRSVSLELLPSNNDEFGGAGTAATIAGSHSAPPSPIRDAPEYSPPRAKMQGFSLDVASATKNLRRMLNLDFDA